MINHQIGHPMSRNTSPRLPPTGAANEVGSRLFPRAPAALALARGETAQTCNSPRLAHLDKIRVHMLPKVLKRCLQVF